MRNCVVRPYACFSNNLKLECTRGRSGRQEDRSGKRHRLGGDHRLTCKRVCLAGLAGASPHGAALELHRNRKLGDLANCVRHRFALSARFLRLGVISANGLSSLSRIEPPSRFNADGAIPWASSLGRRGHTCPETHHRCRKFRQPAAIPRCTWYLSRSFPGRPSASEAAGARLSPAVAFA